MSLVEKVRKVVVEKYREMTGEPLERGGITILTALSDDDIKELVLTALRVAEKPLSWRELKQIFSGIAGEDRLRRILGRLKANNVVAELTRTRYSLPEYVPLNEVHKVKNPGIISKILRLKERHEQ
jgi:hypothetical protein